ncbi:MAG: PDR/VanB family oxidoreductase [Alphaproteobacteria bacterium]|nr:PDR/VanB family oxidoreductase [Alphaproteobacteria bacterium]
MNDSLIDVLVHSVTSAAEGIRAFELHAADGRDLPAFTAGSHIDLHLPNGLVRNYSLVNSPAERHRYVIAVSLDANSTGGSKYLHENDLQGAVLKISTPRNNFPLIEDGAPKILIAGGIGITPLYAMIQRMEEIGDLWMLFYGARSRACAAFREELEALDAKQPGRVNFNFDDEAGQMLDVTSIAVRAPLAAHLYCCGPSPMLDAFNMVTANRMPDMVHVEYFTAPTTASENAADAADLPETFTVEIAGTGQSFEVKRGQSILGVLMENGVYAASSCQEGCCGTCVVQVLEGIPDHKDFVLSDRERATNQMMTICVSGSKSKKLLIDLD